MISFEQFTKNYDCINNKIKDICKSSNRNADNVKILPVTKTQPPAILEYLLRHNLDSLGENRVGEALTKKTEESSTLRWELIGHLQSNKVRLAVQLFDRIQSVDSAKLVERLDEAAQEQGIKLRILLQVNAGNDPAKFGVSGEQAPSLLESALNKQNLTVEGLMTIAPLNNNVDVATRTFTRLRQLRDKLSDNFGVKLAELSMGMSGDLEPAINAGSTQLRIGTALFGMRWGRLGNLALTFKYTERSKQEAPLWRFSSAS